MQGATDNIKDVLRSDNKNYFENGEIEFTGFKHSINFVSVGFGYDDTSLVLNNISLTIEKGQMTALVGASGAGKTTLADLIMRFYDPIIGEVLIDGVDLRHIEINSLRGKLAMVSQDTFIFNTTVRNNIAYGTNDATEPKIMEAAQLANALEFIQEMPEGFETILGDRGVRLSGGQRQRIAIARALLRNPEILILDEATSALDSVSERLIQDSIEQLTVGRTVIAIAHRLSTIARADQVVVLEQGRIVEQGKYQELLKQRGRLWKYHQMQHESGASS
jgi:ABC-type multidrug transport system fused ATPase/permease subunit